MKNIKLFLILICTTLLLTSCNYTRLGWHSRAGNGISGKFDYFSGSETRSKKVKKDETISVVVELNVTKGEMYVTLEDDSGNELFKTDISDTFEFTAESDTKIKATVYAEKAGGSYKVTFEK